MDVSTKMSVIVIETKIKAPIDLCFDLARNVDIHIETTDKTREKAVEGITKGFLELGDHVTWEAYHFGTKQRLSVKITEMARPYQFVDEMIKGPFASLRHVHEFRDIENGTLMRDVFKFTCPYGILGLIVDKLFLERYMMKFLLNRNEKLKKIAEQYILD